MRLSEAIKKNNTLVIYYEDKMMYWDHLTYEYIVAKTHMLIHTKEVLIRTVFEQEAVFYLLKK